MKTLLFVYKTDGPACIPDLLFALLPVKYVLSAAAGSDYGLIEPVVIYGMVLGRKSWGKYLVAFLCYQLRCMCFDAWNDGRYADMFYAGSIWYT